MEAFRSVNPELHDAINVDVAKTLCLILERDPESRFILFDGPDLGTTRACKANDQFKTNYHDNFLYFQKNPEIAINQSENLDKMYKRNHDKIRVMDFLNARSSMLFFTFYRDLLYLTNILPYNRYSYGLRKNINRFSRYN